MSFARMHNAVSHLLPKAFNHPVNKGILDGTLPWHAFRFYIEQDYLYLHDFSKALMLVSNKLTSDKHARQFKMFAQEIRDTQRSVHLKYLGEPRSLKLFPANQLPVKKIPVISHYTEHLLDTASHCPVEETVAGLGACYWLYYIVWKKLLNTPCYHPDNPYHLWVLSSTSIEFTISVKAMIQISNELANGISCPVRKKNMVSSFVKSTEYEILFWDSVYKTIELSNEPMSANRLKAG